MAKSKVQRLAVAALTGIFIWSAAAHAASEKGEFAVKGIGIQDCAAFTKAYAERSQGAFVFAGWLDGYLTALNRLQAGTYDAVPWQSIDILLALINSHCAGAPQERLFGVVHALLGFYSEQRLSATSPSVDAAAGDKKITLYREVMRRAQVALGVAGVYSGTPDGVYGPKTKAAIEAFQDRANLPKTGLPDQQTLYQLFERKPPAQ